MFQPREPQQNGLDVSVGPTGKKGRGTRSSISLKAMGEIFVVKNNYLCTLKFSLPSLITVRPHDTASILSAFQKPLRDFVFFNDVDMRTPS